MFCSRNSKCEQHSLPDLYSSGSKWVYELFFTGHNQIPQSYPLTKPTQSSTEVSRPASISEVPVSTSPTNMGLSSSSVQNKTLSTGAAAGIGVGATVGGLGILALLAFFCMRYRRRGEQLKHLSSLATNSYSSPTRSSVPKFAYPEVSNTLPVYSAEMNTQPENHVSEADGRILQQGG
ncbi:hypothetical protein GLAREA_09013 [Glarea lozoyensis ATCC 20868]|uniref:Carcinoembryonic antigen-related cell adhesion molecule 1 n=1 Tax=Glarea lozoyensis (strain ATCC 20868 / MF5171) TaxID=1116229 RepID=S3DGP5_GLAL2|nr:uncharacterized protein GLAREA_09013 [Glarea lozoyensis ATCC 20868]EPE36850.1 hypothetical protein GLAREA_09013 [Glarea lozoyensis ATCC 20868]